MSLRSDAGIRGACLLAIHTFHGSCHRCSRWQRQVLDSLDGRVLLKAHDYFGWSLFELGPPSKKLQLAILCLTALLHESAIDIAVSVDHPAGNRVLRTYQKLHHLAKESTELRTALFNHTGTLPNGTLVSDLFRKLMHETEAEL